MTKITSAEVDKIVKLANLNLPKDEKEAFIGQLNSILLHMDELNGLDTTGIEPTLHAISINNAFRDDIVTTSFDRESSLKNAPDKDGGYFRVPKIIENV